LGVVRIKRNLAVDTDDVVSLCAAKISSSQAVIERTGKNWYVSVDDAVIVVNAHSFHYYYSAQENDYWGLVAGNLSLSLLAGRRCCSSWQKIVRIE
jgi:hypothetical protein